MTPHRVTRLLSLLLAGVLTLQAVPASAAQLVDSSTLRGRAAAQDVGGTDDRLKDDLLQTAPRLVAPSTTSFPWLRYAALIPLVTHLAAPLLDAATPALVGESIRGVAGNGARPVVVPWLRVALGAGALAAAAIVSRRWRVRWVASRHVKHERLAEEAAPSAPAPVGAREMLLNSDGQSFDEVWAAFTAARDPQVYDDAALATLLAQLHDAPASADERHYAAGFAQMTLEEFGQTFRAFISSTPPVFSDLPHLLKKEPTDNVALLREFLDALSRGLRRDDIMLLQHHIMNPYNGIQYLTTLLEDSSLSDEVAHQYREIVQQKCQAQAFIRELLLHRWRKPSDEEPGASDGEAEVSTVYVPALERTARVESGILPPTSVSTRLFLRLITEYPERFAGKRVLELGTGTGVLTIALARAGAEVIAVDILPAAIKNARANLETELEEVQHRVRLGLSDLYANLEMLFGESSLRFDVVIFNNPIHDEEPDARTPMSYAVNAGQGYHIIRRALAGLPERLTPGGEAYVLAANGADWTVWNEDRLRQAVPTRWTVVLAGPEHPETNLAVFRVAPPASAPGREAEGERFRRESAQVQQHEPLWPEDSPPKPPPSGPMLPLPGPTPAARGGTDQIERTVESLGASAGEV